jgi:hypothetical protein
VGKRRERRQARRASASASTPAGQDDLQGPRRIERRDHPGSLGQDAGRNVLRLVDRNHGVRVQPDG